MSLHVTNHAITRYIERVRDVPESLARAEIKRMAAYGEWHMQTPAWLREHTRRPDCWLVAGDVAVALWLDGRSWVATTVLTSASMTDELRDRRRRAKRSVRHGRAGARLAQKRRPTTVDRHADDGWAA